MPLRALAPVLAPLLLAAAPGDGSLAVDLSGVRSAKGVLLLCLTAQPRHFPDCGRDPAARMITVPASSSAALRFEGLAPGRYALSVMHDENGNGRLDTMLRIPREGFGFSRNPVVRFGAPKFSAVAFALPRGETRIAVRMKYFL